MFSFAINVAAPNDFKWVFISTSKCVQKRTQRIIVPLSKVCATIRITVEDICDINFCKIQKY